MPKRQNTSHLLIYLIILKNNNNLAYMPSWGNENLLNKGVTYLYYLYLQLNKDWEVDP